MHEDNNENRVNIQDTWSRYFGRRHGSKFIRRSQVEIGSRCFSIIRQVSEDIELLKDIIPV